MTACPGGKLLETRRTAPLSNTMTVLASSRAGLGGPGGASPLSPGKLRIVTETSKQTGLDRVVCSELLSELPAVEPGFVKLSKGESPRSSASWQSNHYEGPS